VIYISYFCTYVESISGFYVFCVHPVKFASDTWIERPADFIEELPTCSKIRKLQ